MNDNDRINVARDYVSRHKNSDPSEWQPHFSDDDENMLAIYNNMVNGVYSSSDYSYRPEFPDEFQIEISSIDAKNGQTQLYEWYDAEWYNIVSTEGDND